MKLLAGVDIGGTKCAVSLGKLNGSGGIDIVVKVKMATPPSPEAAIEQLIQALEDVASQHPEGQLAAVGISCGGPLDSRRGLILSPPNLPGWDAVDIVTPFTGRFGVPAALQNDANACALAEWNWGAGQGCRNMIFLTFGTGMGAGLILNGALYAGTNDMAGEVGHMRLEPAGPVGYGKAGSFEGFCSGGGIAQLAQHMARRALDAGDRPSFCQTYEELPLLSAENVGRAAELGDPLAQDIYRLSARKLGQTLAVLVDVLNPEKIVIGSIYGRQKAIMEPYMRAELERESLPLSLSVCEVVQAGLGEAIGDYASLSVALNDLIEKGEDV
ncbi:ROK family protein [Paenibacillus rhizovicinus]|uniref:ROK family protein n=1 Tax=Paenibacillus rhizovicinus TaxID=2704463 RepID=A0A6C0P4Q2_9BACL|nr:ROK family protein [Paenibacillus rhizovicinus]QHW33524.1 ROK family protein [Paenibacillus rhizovicinus]